MTRLLLLFMAVVTAMSTYAVDTAGTSPDNYCVYFLAPNGMTPEQVRVHVWNKTNNVDVMPWDDDETMMLAGWSSDGNAMIFKYEFQFAYTPENVIFRVGPYQTPDLRYTDGALYNNNGAVIAQPGFEYQAANNATVYFYDKENWGSAYTTLWSDSGATLYDRRATETGLYYNDGEEYFPVYKFDIVYTGSLTSISFAGASNAQTAMMPYTENGLYHYAGDHVAADVVADAPSVIGPWTKPYCVYLIAPGLTNINTWTAHVWDNAGNNYKEWEDDDQMVRTDKYTIYNGEACPVFRYDFAWDKTPANIIFHFDKAQTADLQFVEDGVYVFRVKGSGLSEVFSLDDLELFEATTQTIYFADALGWGDNNIRAHIWGDTGDYMPFASSPFLTPTGKYTRIGNLYRPVYELTITTLGEGYTDYVQFRRNEPIAQAANNKFVDGGLYYYTNQPLDEISTDFELVDEVPVTPGTVYFHIGANQILTGLWEKPRAHFHLRGETFSLPLDDDSDYELMREVDEGLWAIDIENTQLHDAVTFYYLRKNDLTGEMEAHTFPSTEPSYYDFTNYATYIYDIGTTCVYQSYMTPAQYEAQRGKEREVIYITGNKAAGFADDNWLLTESQAIPSEHGVFFREVIAGSQAEPTDFKLSWVNVKEYAEAAGEMFRYENQRGWATFNLGLYGYETRNVDWQVDTEYDYNHNRVQIVYPNMSVGYNSFNQYGWRVSSRSTPGHEAIIEGQKYWLVIDTHEDDHSVTLLDFDPNPHVTFETGRVEAVELGYDRAVTLHSGLELEASDVNGHVYFDRVNVASGVANVEAAENDKLDEADFSVTYTVYTNNIPVAVIEGKPGEIAVPFIPVGADVDIAVRAHYTDTQTGYSFCSRYSSGTTNNAPDLVAPSISESFKTLALKDGIESENDWAFDALLNFGYEIQTSLAVYPDFHLEATDGYHIANPQLADGGRLTSPAHYPTIPVAGYLNWTAYDQSGAYDDQNNWSKKIWAENSLPLHLESVLEIEKDRIEESELNLTLQAHGVYPFLVNVAPSHQEAQTLALVENSARLPDDLSDFVIVPVRVSTSYATTLNYDNITGIESVEADADPTAPVEYYNLQGLRVLNPEGGIFIRRQGNKVTKVIL